MAVSPTADGANRRDVLAGDFKEIAIDIVLNIDAAVSGNSSDVVLAGAGVRLRGHVRSELQIEGIVAGGKRGKRETRTGSDGRGGGDE